MCVLVWMCLTFILVPITSGAKPNKNILILGGNGFLGGETTVKLAENGHNITLLNRGNTYYDSNIRVKPIVTKNILCDREISLALECSEFKNNTQYFDIVIDFTSYSPKHLLEVAQLLKRRIGLYIFISSGAVYRVSTINHTRASKEDEMVRPVSPERRRELKKEEPYGDEKLACEETLMQQEKEGGFPFVILRLPAVIGPRDTTFRWWIYQLWILTHQTIHYPVHIPDGIRSELFSLVYVDDVADVISRIVAMDTAKINNIKNMAYNLAFIEHVSLPRIIKDIANYYSIDKVEHEGDDNSTWYVYPPGAKAAMDISLARDILDWDPTPWKKAVEKTCEFNHRAMTKELFAREKEMVLADMAEEVVPIEYFQEFLMKLKQHFGPAVLDGIELQARIPDGAPEIDTAAPKKNEL